MEKPKCGICSRVFSNRKALGGHMRAHLSTLPVPPKIEPPTSSSSSHNHDDEQDEDEKGLRLKPKRSFKLVDNLENFDSGFVIQDQESETDEAELTQKKPTRKRSKRSCRKTKKMVLALRAESVNELSSVTCASSDEDVAMCLMMLSRDVWCTGSVNSFELRPSQTTQRRKGKYQCETCNKVFKTFQALGGHKNSHKNIKNLVQENHDNVGAKLHECPFCYKLFKNGQALGGHKRTHFLSSSTKTSPSSSTKSLVGNDSGSLVNSTKFVENLVIDLNLPAPMEDGQEEGELLEVSAVSDAELTPSSS